MRDGIQIISLSDTDQVLAQRYATDGVVLVECDATSGNVAITLDDPNDAKDTVLMFKRTDGSANTVTITGTIDGAASITLTAQYEVRCIVSNGLVYKEVFGSGVTSPASHTHGDYLNKDGSVALTANWDAGSFKITAQTLESDVATGTAPLTVASTTAVTNLNADLLDGNHAAAFAAAAHLHDGDTLQNDGINSDGGVFSLATTGAVLLTNGIAVVGNHGAKSWGLEALQFGEIGALSAHATFASDRTINFTTNAYYDTNDSRWEYWKSSEYAHRYRQGSTDNHTFETSVIAAGANGAITWLDLFHIHGNGTNSEVVVNESKIDCDFWINGDTTEKVFSIDAGVEQGAIGTTTMSRKWNVADTTATTNAVLTVARYTADCSATAANGFGVGVEFEADTIHDGLQVGGKLDCVVTDGGNPNEAFDFVWGLMESGAAPAERMRLTSAGALTATGGVYVGGSNNELRFYEGANYVGFEAPALAADQIWVLPAADGAASAALITNGSGTLSWGAATPAAHVHDGDTLQMDGVNSNGGAFPFTVGGVLTFSGGRVDVEGTSHASNPQFNVGDVTGGSTYLGFGSLNSSYAWIQSFGSDPLVINPLGNNVGIGGTASVFQLHQTLSGNVSQSMYAIRDSDSNYMLTVESDAGGDAFVDVRDTTGTTKVRLHSDGTSYFNGGNLEVTGNMHVLGASNELRLYEGANYVGFEAPALAADQIWVLPTADGNASDFLQTNGAGTLSWAAAGGGTPAGANTQVQYNSSGSFGADANFTWASNELRASVTAGFVNTNLGYKIGTTTVLRKPGSENIYVGGGAGSGTGSSCVYVGHNAGVLATSNQNVGVGRAAVAYAGGVGNVGIGYHAALGAAAGCTGTNNSAMGTSALAAFTSGSNNIGIGANAGDNITTGGKNMCIGGSSVTVCTTTNFNCAVGVDSLRSTTASANVGIGNEAMYSNSSGGGNIGIGYRAGYSQQTGLYNTMIGYQAGYKGANYSTQNNTLIGGWAGNSIVTGSDDNVCIGFESGYVLAGDGNVFVGHQAGRYETGSNTLMIDNTARTNEADGRVKSLIFGTFNAATASQEVLINGYFQAREGLGGLERSSNPASPAEGEYVIWMSDGTGHGDDGDVMVVSTAGGTTNYGTLFDHSAGSAF